MLTFAHPNGESLHSLGGTAIARGGCTSCVAIQIDEFMVEMALPERDAIAAAVQFLESHELPTAVTWEADW